MSRVWAALFVSAIAVASAGAQDWTAVPLGTSADIHCLTTGGGFWTTAVVGDSGFVARSDDNTTFTRVQTGTSANLLSTMDIGAIYVSGANGTVRMSFGGSRFNRDLPDAAHDYVLFSRGHGSAFALGTGGGIYHSDNYGATWSAQSSGTSYPLHAGADGAYAVGDHGTFIKTTDQGANWTSYATGTTANLYAFLDGNGFNEVALGEGGTIIRSTDGGVTWSPRTSGTTSTLRAISSLGAFLFVAVGDGGTVLKTTDSGDTWCRLNSGTTTNLYGVAVLDNGNYLVGGQGGLLLRTTNGGGPCASPSGVEPILPAGSSALQLAGPFPNPIQTVGEFRLETDRDEKIRVEVVDTGGRVVATLLDGDMRAGERRRLGVSTLNWSQGVYFVTARGDGSRTARRFLIVR